MSNEKLTTLLSFFKALGDESRLRILGLLASREYTVQELAETLELKEPTVSHHLAKLKEIELVASRSDGNHRFYRLEADSLETMVKSVMQPEHLVEAASQDLDLDRFSRRVLETFLEDGKLREIPAQRKKRDVVLNWLVDHFDPQRRYTEKEVNDILKRYHWDSATLRREFIMTKLMQRQDGFYWRT